MTPTYIQSRIEKTITNELGYDLITPRSNDLLDTTEALKDHLFEMEVRADTDAVSDYISEIINEATKGLVDENGRLILAMESYETTHDPRAPPSDNTGRLRGSNSSTPLPYLRKDDLSNKPRGAIKDLMPSKAYSNK